MTQISNRTVLITGGAQGIGKLLAQRCLEEKAHRVILWDINERNLEATKEEFAKKGWKIGTNVVDIANYKEIRDAADDVRAAYGSVDILFNNAGIVVGKPFCEHDHRDISKTIDINVSGCMHTALAFINDMIEQQEGHIINIASAAGLMANPNMSVYAASKWAVVGWSESIRIEMERNKTGVKVLTVMPGYINTGMFNGAKSPIMTPMLEPDFIVDKIIKAVKSNEIILQEPFMVRSVPLLRGLLPTRVFDVLADKIFGVYNTMDSFVGRPSHEAVPDKDNFKK